MKLIRCLLQKYYDPITESDKGEDHMKKHIHKNTTNTVIKL